MVIRSYKMIDFTDKVKETYDYSILEPWVEKYRPSRIEDIFINETLMRKLKQIIENKDMPNLIITGSPGSGKTSAVICMAKQILQNAYLENCIEMNASNNRGLDILNNSIIHFCKKEIDSKIPHKIVILDEADNITTKAQQSLSNIIEEHDNTRFAFTCNDINKIIEPIQSRCIILKFNHCSIETTMEKLRSICKHEKVSYTDEGLKAIIETSNNDLRQCINNMEMIFFSYNDITRKNVIIGCDVPINVQINNLIETIKTKAFNKSIELVDKTIDSGFSLSDICLFMIENMKESNYFTELDRIKCIDIISQTYMSITNGNDSKLQIYSCIAQLISLNL